MGGVFSQSAGFTSLSQMGSIFAFHAICMALGMFLLGRTVAAKPAAVPVEVTRPGE